MRLTALVLPILIAAGAAFWFWPSVQQFFHERRMAELHRKHEEAKVQAAIIREKIASDPNILSECSVIDKQPRTDSLVKSDGGTKANLDETNTITANAGRVLIQTEATISSAGSIALRKNQTSFGAYEPANGTPLENYFASSVSHRLTCYDVGRLGDASCKVSSTVTISEVGEKCAQQMIERIKM